MRYNRISPLSELSLLIQEAFLVLIGETRNLIISLLFPLIAMLVTIWIAGEEMFINFESTKSGCFIVVCAAIWCGLFNSIQVVVKERAIIKREYVSGALRIECYTISRFLIQTGLCLLQSIVLSLCFLGVEAIYGNDLPRHGLVTDAVFLAVRFHLPDHAGIGLPGADDLVPGKERAACQPAFSLYPHRSAAVLRCAFPHRRCRQYCIRTDAQPLGYGMPGKQL